MDNLSSTKTRVVESEEVGKAPEKSVAADGSGQEFLSTVVAPRTFNCAKKTLKQVSNEESVKLLIVEDQVNERMNNSSLKNRNYSKQACIDIKVEEESEEASTGDKGEEPEKHLKEDRVQEPEEDKIRNQENKPERGEVIFRRDKDDDDQLTYLSDQEIEYDEDGGYVDEDGRYIDAEGGYRSDNGTYYDSYGGYWSEDGCYHGGFYGFDQGENYDNEEEESEGAAGAFLLIIFLTDSNLYLFM